jgi:hypothetical protein
LRSHVDKLVDGFLPMVPAGTKPSTRRAALQGFGLPYASDAALSKHLAAFLHERDVDAVLFNGGVMKSDALRGRMMDVLQHLVGRDVALLPGANLDAAVALGAASFGRMRTGGQGVRIRGGTTRSFFVGIERAELAVPGFNPPIDAMCIAPAGMEEGSAHALPGTLGVIAGEAVEFRFFASPVNAVNNDNQTRAGDKVDPQRAELEELAPIETVITSEAPAGTLIPIHLQAALTDVGVLEISAVEANGQRHRLSFSTRS